MSYSLFLDDCRMPHQVNWVRIPDVEYEIVRSYEDFVAKIEKKGLPEFVSFDHDLCVEHYKQMADLFYKKNGSYQYNSFEEKTGYDCAKWLIQYCEEKNLDFPKYAIHSMSPVGRSNIHAAITSYASYRSSKNKRDSFWSI